MEHASRIDDPPIRGTNRLRFRGRYGDRRIRIIIVHPNDELEGDRAEGTCDATIANISVSSDRFKDLNDRVPSFDIVIEADSNTVVSKCTVVQPSELAA